MTELKSESTENIENEIPKNDDNNMSIKNMENDNKIKKKGRKPQVEKIDDVDIIEKLDDVDNIDNGKVKKVRKPQVENLDDVDNGKVKKVRKPKVEKLDDVDIIENLDNADNIDNGKVKKVRKPKVKKLDDVDIIENLDDVDNGKVKKVRKPQVEKLDDVDIIENLDDVDNGKVKKVRKPQVEKLDDVDIIENLDNVDNGKVKKVRKPKVEKIDDDDGEVKKKVRKPKVEKIDDVDGEVKKKVRKPKVEKLDDDDGEVKKKVRKPKVEKIDDVDGEVKKKVRKPKVEKIDDDDGEVKKKVRKPKVKKTDDGGIDDGDGENDRDTKQKGEKYGTIEDEINGQLVEEKIEPIQEFEDKKTIYRTVLTRNGYRINKTYFDEQLINAMKVELTVKPICKDEDKQPEPYPIYRETPSELIVPRFYGRTKLGEPEKTILNDGVTKVAFNGKLRDYQIDIVNKAVKHMKEVGGGIISVPCGRGKCFAKGTKILMYDGTVKRIEDINVSDKLMGDDSTVRNVISLGHGYDQLYDVKYGTRKYTVNAAHILSLMNVKTNTIIDLSIEEYLKLSDQEKVEYKGVKASVNFTNCQKVVNPYLFGVNLLTQDSIPHEYKCGTRENRIKLIDGLLINDNIPVVDNDRLISDVIYVCNSLGLKTRIIDNKLIIDRTYHKNICYNMRVDVGTYGEYYGLEIDGNHRLLLEDFTITHNTVMGIKIACELGAKTLVIVHKTNLQDQWIERYQQFTDAKIGIIRQNKVQVKGYDVVIGMLQSLSMKEYDPSIFSEFKVVIFDECHHAPARMFSNALYKAGAKYVLGLSATPNRLDGLTKVLHWYLGDFIHYEKARKNKQVVAKIFHYKSNDKLFKEVKKWPKYKVNPIAMLGNLCQIKQRTKHIVDIINEIRKDPRRKILILSNRKQHLDDMKKSVDESINEDIINNKILPGEIRTFLYTGDLKKHERKEAETHGDILFGTFEIAHEGLDIERLNTIVLATPKKDVVQAVGRIMRRILKNGDIKPLIIDICDELSIFTYHGNCRISQYNNGHYRTENYYLKNDKILTYDTYMMQEENMTQEEIEKSFDRIIYDPTWKSILTVKEVDDIDVGITCDITADELKLDDSENENENENVQKIKFTKLDKNAYLF